MKGPTVHRAIRGCVRAMIWMVWPMLIVAVPAQNLTYVITNSTVIITGPRCPDAVVEVPNEINGLPVTAIGLSAFTAHCGTPMSVTLPDSLTSIGEGAFGGCANLTNLTMPNSVTSIGSHAFDGCSRLPSVSIPDQLSVIDIFTFSDCSNLASVVIPSQVYSVGNNAFSDCAGLTNVTMGSSLSNIGHYAFLGCANLTNVSIPNSVNSLGFGSFWGCSRLSTVTIGTSVQALQPLEFADCTNLTNIALPRGVSSIDSSAFEGCYNLVSITVDPLNTWYSSLDGVLFDKGQTSLVIFPEGKAGAYTIPKGVTIIGKGAFSGCINLTSVTIPQGVSNILQEAFAGCAGLSSLNIPGSVTTLGDSAFRGCTGLTNVAIPTTITTIPGRGFSACFSLRTVAIPSTVTNIGDEAFSRCIGLRSVSIPDRVTFLGDGSFSGCSSMADVTIGQSVATIGGQAFWGCSSLTNIAIPASATSIGTLAFAGCDSLRALIVDPLNPSYSAVDGVLFDKAQSTLIQYPGGKVGDYAVPNGVTTIGVQSFSGNAHLINVTIPSSVTALWAGAFSLCSNLSGVYFQGNAPSVSGWDTNLTYGTVYYLPGTTGWGPTFDGHPTVLWNPQVRTSGTSFGVRQNVFGFNIGGMPDIPFVVEASTNVFLGLWTPLQSSTLTNGLLYFSDPQWTNYPSRFYRIRSP